MSLRGKGSRCSHAREEPRDRGAAPSLGASSVSPMVTATNAPPSMISGVSSAGLNMPAQAAAHGAHRRLGLGSLGCSSPVHPQSESWQPLSLFDEALAVSCSQHSVSHPPRQSGGVATRDHVAVTMISVRAIRRIVASAKTACTTHRPSGEQGRLIRRRTSVALRTRQADRSGLTAS